MEWFKKHTDTVVVLGGILSAIIWMNGKFSDVQIEFNHVRKDILAVKEELNDVRTEVAIVKTVLIMKGIMPDAYAYTDASVKPNA